MHQIPIPIADILSGQKVRVYELSFAGYPIKDFFREGVVIGPDDIFKEIYAYRIERVFLPLSGECPHSWQVGEIGQFNINYPHFEMIGD